MPDTPENQEAYPQPTSQQEGLGFPLLRGGPMFYADSVGLMEVVSAIRRYARGLHPKPWTPAPLLEKLAASGSSFATFDSQSADSLS